MSRIKLRTCSNFVAIIIALQLLVYTAIVEAWLTVYWKLITFLYALQNVSGSQICIYERIYAANIQKISLP